VKRTTLLLVVINSFCKRRPLSESSGPRSYLKPNSYSRAQKTHTLRPLLMCRSLFRPMGRQPGMKPGPAGPPPHIKNEGVNGKPRKLFFN
jgi:ribosomal protein S14